MKTKSWGDLQVPHSHYFSTDYLNKDRFIGLYGQVISCIKDVEAKNILEIGPGPGLFSAIMKNFGKDVITVDFAPDLPNDVQARLPLLPFLSNSFDTVCAFEVLEHIPFNLFSISLKEMCRISKNKIIISVPNVTYLNPFIDINLNIKLKKFRYHISFRRSRNRKIFNQLEHYWELGINGIGINSILEQANGNNLKILETFYIEPWFQFFIFQKTPYHERPLP